MSFQKNKLENRIYRQIQDPHATFGIKERRKHRGHLRNCTVALLSFYPKGWNRAYICSTGRGFRDIGRFFFSKLPYLTIKLGHWQKFQSCTYTLFLPKGFKIELIVFKIAILGMKLGHWQKFQKLHMYFLRTQGVKNKLIFALRAAVFEMRPVFQNFHIWA